MDTRGEEAGQKPRDGWSGEVRETQREREERRKTCVIRAEDSGTRKLLSTWREWSSCAVRKQPNCNCV